ncbi:MAG: NAD(P)-binding domain-containing protein [Candidatus Kapabacteria bacterium]|nr:NAD(P)-binding domain-containing protein [Candidatus Kapabacteria bacterium]
MIKIGILGSGMVAQALATGFMANGHEVMLGTRSSSKLLDWQKQSGGFIGTFAQTAEFGDIVVLAVKGNSAESALNMAGSVNLKGKLIIDTTNPIADVAPTNGVLNFFTDLNSSLMEQLQNSFPEASFVKAFSSVGAALMVNPDFNGIKPSMFICGNNFEAKAKVTSILGKFGWEAEDMGGAEAARAIEPLCMLWCIPGFTRNSWSHAFKLLKK